MKQEIEYNKALTGATFDAIKAFQVNTANNMYTGVADSLIRDVNSTINSFMTSLTLSLNVSGAGKDWARSYMPALAMVMYDGYYIYTPQKVTDTTSSDYEKLTHILKPYIYYTKKYDLSSHETLVINYTLDNFFSIYYKSSSTYMTKTGYYIKDIFSGNTVTNDIGQSATIWDAAAKKYYTTDNITQLIKDITHGTACADIFDNWEHFDQERRDVIQEQIQSSLYVAIENYNVIGPDSGVYTFEMPLLSPEDWELAMSNVSLITFLQGMSLGDRYYNGYAVSAAFSCPYYTSEDEMCYVATATQTFHKIDCRLCPDYTDEYGKYMKIVKAFPDYTACYYCMVGGNGYDKKVSNPTWLQLKYNSAANLKWNLTKRANELNI